MTHGVQNMDASGRDSYPALAPASTQAQIVSGRGDHVSQHFGQITPSEERVPSSSKAPPAQAPPSQETRGQDPSKLSNEQRARNAANTRHSRSRNAKQQQRADHADPTEAKSEDGQKPGKSLHVQREKNRVAAAKCRAKKKSANEHQAEMASQFSSTNNVLTKEIRDLKNQKAEFQNLLLAHRAGVCACHGIHDYNYGQAQRLVSNARRQVVETSSSSPSQTSLTSNHSPLSEGSGTMFHGSSMDLSADGMGIHPRAGSFDDPMSYAFNQNGDPDTLHTTSGDPLMHREFAEFLQSSPGSRAGFA